MSMRKKVILFVPKAYSLAQVLLDGFEELNCDVKVIDYEDYFHRRVNRFYNKTKNLPKKLNFGFSDYYIEKVNILSKKIVASEKPDIIVIYNDQYLYPETIKHLKDNFCPVINILGDNPFYTFGRVFNIAAMMEMSFVLAPDSYWIKQLKMIGVKNIDYFYPGYSKKLNFKINDVSKYLDKYKSDIVVIGRQYNINWGYKRALFYNHFSKYDFKIFGNDWEPWFKYFPELKGKYIPQKSRMSFEELNIILNCSKIYPIEKNPGLLSGQHLRVYESIGSEVLPIVEESEDNSLIFKECFIPTIKCYSDIENITDEYISNETKRLKTVKELKKYFDCTYSPKLTCEKIISVSGQ